MSSIAKAIAPIAASFIPGVGAIAGPALGAVLGGVGSGGAQGGVNYNTSGNQSTTQNQSTKNIEPEYFQDFRKSLMGSFGGELDRAMNTQIYGPAQRAGFIQEQNDLGSAAMEAAKSGLARMGRLNSGAADTSVGDIEMQKFGNISNFYSQLPFMEDQARTSKVQNLLGMGANWAGRAPVDQEMSGTSKTENTSQTQQQQMGAPWWKNMLYGIGGAMGRTAQDGNSASSFTPNVAPAWNSSLPSSVNMLNPFSSYQR